MDVPKLEKPSAGLHVPLLKFSDQDQWSISDATEGSIILGTNGSGKTSGCGQTIALQFLRHQLGGLVCVCKPSEVDLWKYYCQVTGRANDLIVFEPGGKYRFNFIDYEARLQQGAGVGLAANIADIILKLSDVSDGKGQQNDAFWKGEQTKILINPIETVILSGDPLTPKSIYDLVVSAPGSEEDLQSETWRKKSTCYQTLLKIRKRIERGELDDEEIADYRVLEDYWLFEHCRLAEKTRGIVRAMFTSFFTEFNRRPNRKLFCEDTTITPEACLEGKIILLNLPVREYGKVGAVAQKLFKLMFQRTVERSTKHLEKRLPAFLWADEFQEFFYAYDSQFQATARESKVATVYLTQNLPNAYIAAGGGQDAENRIKALLANLNTKFFLVNDCPITNKYASELIGQKQKWTQSRNTSMGGEASFSHGEQENFDFIIRPEQFHSLRNGGPRNNYLVDAYMVKTAMTFKINQSPVLLTTFNQKLSS